MATELALGLNGAGPAVTLDEYRDAWKVNRGFGALTDLLPEILENYLPSDELRIAQGARDLLSGRECPMLGGGPPPRSALRRR